MRIAISLPDATFEEATMRAQEMGISRSEFFTRAARYYLGRLDRTLTQQIDHALATAGGDDSSATPAEAGKRRLRR